MEQKQETNCIFCEHRSKGFVEGRGPCSNKKAIEFRGTAFPFAELDKKPCPFYKEEPED
jgi:hypothetical protein